MDSVVKEVNLSCSFFLSLWMFLSKGLYFFKIRSSNNKNIKISIPTIHELANTYTIVIKDATNDEIMPSSLPKVKLNESASLLIRFITSPEDNSS